MAKLILSIEKGGRVPDVDTLYALRDVVRRNSPADATGSDISRNVSDVLNIAWDKSAGINGFTASFADGTQIAFVRTIPANVRIENVAGIFTT